MDDSIPSEFAAFIREVGVRAFDRVADRTKEAEVPLRPILRTWAKLSGEEKSALFDRLIACAQMPELAPDPPKPRKRTPAKRYTPEEAEETLPKKRKKL